MAQNVFDCRCMQNVFATYYYQFIRQQMHHTIAAENLEAQSKRSLKRDHQRDSTRRWSVPSSNTLLPGTLGVLADDKNSFEVIR
jgi:hypothetical protein